MAELNDLRQSLDAAEEKNRLNNLVAVSVALISVFMGITKVKDDQFDLSDAALSPSRWPCWQSPP